MIMSNKNMKKLLIPVALVAMTLLMGSCMAGKKVPYFQNIDEISLAASKGLYNARIMPKDQLLITVSGVSDPKAVSHFNMTMGHAMNTSGNITQGGNTMIGYLVDNDGTINFPRIGRIHVGGLTTRECEKLLQDKVKMDLAESENPIVTVRLSSFRVVVIGEIGTKVVPVNNEQMSIIECIAQCGDLGIYGRRDNILLVREDATGQKHHVRLNLNDANIFNSPYYYLQQNDIIYVEPNKVKAKNAALGSSTSMWFTFIGFVTSLATLLVNIIKK